MQILKQLYFKTVENLKKFLKQNLIKFYIY